MKNNIFEVLIHTFITLSFEHVVFVWEETGVLGLRKPTCITWPGSRVERQVPKLTSVSVRQP